MIEERHIARLWERMVRMYGHKWTSNYGTGDDGTWLAGLRNLEPEQLAHGITLCIISHDDWPPSMPEFRRMCLDIPEKHVAVSRIRQATANRTLDQLDPFLRRVAQRVGSWKLGDSSGRELEFIIGGAYDDTLDQMERGSVPGLAADLGMAKMAASAVKQVGGADA